MSFWDTLPKPFFAMAPMADVTDPAWRALVASYGKPDITFTEFVSADGLYHTREPNVGRTTSYISDETNPLMRDLQYSEAERPIVMQVFSGKPEMIAYAAQLASELRFDGLDINMGCPDRTIEHQGAGAMLIKTPKLAQELIHAAQHPQEYLQNWSYRTVFVGSDFTPLPVSVKTRIGFNTETLDGWLPALLEARPAAVTLHLRTRKEMSLIPAHWELMSMAVEMRNRLAPEVLLMGNGDVHSLEEAQAKAVESGCDGVMIGRGMFGNPWVFANKELYRNSVNANNLRLEEGEKIGKGEERSIEEKLAALVALARRFEVLTPPKHFAILKKHIKAFVTGFDGAAELRAHLMEAENAAQLEAAVRSEQK